MPSPLFRKEGSKCQRIDMVVCKLRASTYPETTNQNGKYTHPKSPRLRRQPIPHQVGSNLLLIEFFNSSRRRLDSLRCVMFIEHQLHNLHLPVSQYVESHDFNTNLSVTGFVEFGISEYSVEVIWSFHKIVLGLEVRSESLKEGSVIPGRHCIVKSL